MPEGDSNQMKRLLVFAVFCSSLSTVAYSFEYAGFRSGMSVAEAAVAGAQSGHPIFPIKNKPDYFWIGQPPDANGTILFCGDKLASLSLNIAGGLDAYASTTQSFLAQYGQPAAQAQSGYTESGLLSNLQLRWQLDSGEDVTLSLTSFQSGAPYSAVSYGATKSYC